MTEAALIRQAWSALVFTCITFRPGDFVEKGQRLGS
jgi:hypothetical protein